MLRRAVYLIMFFTLGCSLNLREKAKVKQNLLTSKPLSSGDGPVLTLVGLKEHHYLARLIFPRNLQAETLVVNENQEKALNIQGLQEVAVDLNDNQDYLLDLRLKSGALIQRWAIHTPRDFVTSENLLDQTFKQKDGTYLFKGGRFFMNGGPPSKDSADKAPSPFWITEGRSITIDVDELIIDSGVLKTFPEKQKAEKDKAGRSGGLITIKAKRARGHLKFELRGENGGDGSAGAPFPNRAAQGRRGSSAGGFILCVSEPSNGRKGEAGAKGNKGQPGREGGDSGSLRIEVAESSPHFSWEIQFDPGKAGLAGEGGQGQLGGLGGQGGLEMVGCGRSWRGPEGDTGPQGDRGDIENDGRSIPECISIGEGFGRCSQ